MLATEQDLVARRDQLYASDPDEFVRFRKELATAAKQDGDAELAKRITALRKPTAAAGIVNRFVLTDDTVVPRVRELGDRLRDAQADADGIDAALLRELSTRRRTLVRDLTAAALDASGSSPGASTREEVQQTLDAAVADPDVTDRLGQLTHAEQWSGFGTVAVHEPRPRASAKPATKKKPTPTTAPRATGSSAVDRALRQAGAALAEADEQVTVAEADEAAARNRVDELTARLEQLRDELGAAEKDVNEARKAVRDAHARRRDAEKARKRAARR